MASGFSKHLNRSVAHAIDLAKAMALQKGEEQLQPAHLLLALCCQDPQLIRELEGKDRWDVEKLRSAVQGLGDSFKMPESLPSMPLSGALRRVFQTCLRSSTRVRASDIMAALLSHPDEEIRKLIGPVGAPDKPVDEKEGNLRRRNMRIPRELKSFCVDLVTEAESGRLHPAYERDGELKQLKTYLLRSKKSNVVLLGEPGVGKTAILEGLAVEIYEGRVPHELRDTPLFRLDVSGLKSRATTVGGFHRCLRSWIQWASDTRSILFVDELHSLFADPVGETLADALKPGLQNGDLRLIGATTFEEYRRFIERDPALKRRLEVIVVDPPSYEAVLRILEHRRPRLEEYHGVKISDGVLRRALDLSIRCLPDQHLPDKAITVLDSACAATKLRCQEKVAG